MKKRILSLLLIVAISVGLFTGCSKKVSLEDVTSDPAAYIEAGLKKSLGESPIGSLVKLEDTEAISLDAKIYPTEEEGHIKASAVIDHKNLAALINLDTLFEDEAFKGSLFIDKENLAIKSDLLTDIFDKYSVGISLNDLGENIKKTAWYDVFVVQSGLEEQLKNNEGEQIDVEAIIKLYTDYIEEVEKLSKECIKYIVIEDQIVIEDKEIDGYKIVQKTSDDFKSKVEDLADKLIKDIEAKLPDGVIGDVETDIKEIFGQTKFETQNIYFINKKGGALLEAHYQAKFEIVENEEASIDVVINFGKNPEKTFAPSIKATIKSGSDEIVFTGNSTIDKEAKSLVFDINAKYENEEVFKAKITLDKDGNYKLTSTIDEEEAEFSGKFKIDGSKVEFTADIEDGEDTIKIEINLDFDAKKPTSFEYDDLMKWDEEKITNFIEKLHGGSTNSDDLDDFEDLEDFDNFVDF